MTQNDAIRRIYATVHDEFQAVNACIMEQLHSDVALVEQIGHYIIDAGGKRLRPLLVLLSAGACGYKGDRQIPLATIIEFLHTATLLHDDVVDESELRRGRATANDRWGNAPSVLVGDFLYSRAFQMMVRIGVMDVMTTLANATNVIAEGEVMQLMNIHEPDISEAQYMDVIRCKTAMLFEASTHTAALLADAPEEQIKALQDYGNHLGLAFQLVDDLLDYTGDSETMGKNVGDDLAEGKPTLPLIQTIASGTHEQTELVRKAIRNGGLEQLDDVMNAVRASGALDYTASRAREEAEKAVAAASTLPDSDYRQALIELAKLSVSRTA
ncbi:octaprenyl diphosphate synthase [Sansalvadorimonas sp. 2012CJ34-2]|uniref:Octaprenyl diphosphate synthase n=1 Tax=Parendozoicomonas callyspongiae TaxID=2942213 RepID=A0ABT0PDS7_9GAMM|nr:octaprenyl diphosphate synthase [Sansalvadorimonas sp. 2012CJ34-2]MCL6269468.1 octaprenyl diphosphate synthase [Sansalvadorimonas sp. 2012CJ34-2]